MYEKIKTGLGVAAFAALLCACTSERLETTAPSADALSQSSANAITVDEALKSLDDFLYGNQSGSTRADAAGRAIATIDLIRISDLTTKSDADAPSDVDGLVYLVNFEGGEGYAILAADDRIRKDILIVTENGSLSEGELIDAARGGIGREDFSAYPKTGPGIITGEDGEEYINPNTFQIYDENEGDYNVGDFSVQGESESTVHVHCDFGWGGKNNGYFTSGIFDLSVKQGWDNKKDSTLNRNYNWYLKTITYDAPTKE